MGRTTYQMMEDYWPQVAKDKIGRPAEIQFAERFEAVEKIVVSSTLQKVNWKNVRILRDKVIDEVKRLKKEEGGYIAIGSPSLISYLTRAGLIDEFNLLIHPFLTSKGPLLFNDLKDTTRLELLDYEVFDSGVISTHYTVKSHH